MEHLGLVRGCGAPNWIGRERKGHVGTSGPCHPGRSDPRGRPRAWRAKVLIASMKRARFLLVEMRFYFLARLRGDPQGTPRRAGRRAGTHSHGSPRPPRVQTSRGG